jgi:uncharacterized protein with NRDE domain
MSWWDEHPGILAGRDLEAGGTWMGVHRSGRFGVVTNFREPVVDTSGRRSRGELVVGFLTSRLGDDEWAAELDRRSRRYGGFNLVVGGADRLHYLTNRGEHRFELEPGIYGLSNHRLDTPWPKVVSARDRLREIVGGASIEPDGILAILGDRSGVADEDLPDTGVPVEWERLLAPAFIVDERYGTRASTVVLMRADGSAEVVERRFDEAGDRIGECSFEIAADRH